MKRYGDLYEKVYDTDNLLLAHQNARRGKRWYKDVQMVDEDPMHFIKRIQEELINKTYRTSPYDIFTRVEHGKERRIHKLPYYPDRIVHWAIIQVIEPILINTFTADTYSSIPGRGIYYGMRRVQNDLNIDPDGCKYCLKLDIRKYYQSIDHDILKMKYRHLIKDKDLLWLIDEIIDSVPNEEGVPIGNYLSQYSGNLYLSGFDHWIKEEKRVKYYHRYMDDIVIFCDSKDYLHSLFVDICEYLERELQLSVKDNWQIFPTFIRGVDFLGYRFFGDHTLLRKRTAKNLKRKMLKIKEQTKDELTEHNKSVVASYLGWIKHADCYGLYKKYIEPIIN